MQQEEIQKKFQMQIQEGKKTSPISIVLSSQPYY